MFIDQLIRVDESGQDFSGLQPFVFSRSPTGTVEVPDYEGDGVLSVPFDLWSIESEGSGTCILAPRMDDEIPIAVLCIVVRELAPAEYEFTLLAEHQRTGTRRVATVRRGDFTGEAYRSMLATVELFLNRIHGEHAGLITTGARVKYKTKQGKQVVRKEFKPSTVVYISPRQNHKCATGNSVVNWTHTWAVRGHWRRLANADSKGIDRRGERTVTGFTWVKSCHKGEGILVSKTHKL